MVVRAEALSARHCAVMASTFEFAAKTVSTFSNWPICAFRIGLGKLVAPTHMGGAVPIGSSPVYWRTRSGLSILTPPRDGAWGALFEVMLFDCYRLSDPAWLPPHDIGTFVDLGANIGSFSLTVTKRFPDARGIAVEASPDTFAWLRKNLSGNVCARDVKPLNAAVVGASAGATVNLAFNPSASWLSMVGASANPTVVVQTITVDDVLSMVPGTIDLLKIDIEGSEHGVFRTARPETLGRVTSLVLEYHKTEDAMTLEDIVQRLADSGLREYGRQVQDNECTLLWFTRRA